MKSYCLPYLLYASDSVPLSATNIRALDNCINRAMYKIFGSSDGDGMFMLRNFLGLPPLSDVIEKRSTKFIDKLLDYDGLPLVLRGFVHNIV